MCKEKSSCSCGCAPKPLRTRLGRPSAGIIKAADGTVLPGPYSEQQRLLDQQKLLAQQQAGAGAAAQQQVSGVVQQVAGSLGPTGQAVAAGLAVTGAISSTIDKATTDKDGFAQTDNGSTFARGLGQSLNPLSAISTVTSGFQHLNDSKMSTAEKIGAFIPGVSAFALRGSVERAREKYLQKKNDIAIGSAVQQNQAANYQGLAYAREGGTVPILAVGGAAPAAAPPRRRVLSRREQLAAAASAPAPLTPQQQQAQQYYDNILPTMDKMIARHYDETYTPAGSKQQCVGNSCVSFANSAQEQALGVPAAPRDKAHLYNPEFARTHDEQGWQRIALDQLQPGDRVQRWKPAATSTNGLQRQADTGGADYYAGGQPTHMMVFGGYQNQGEHGVGATANWYEDGLSDQPARRRSGPLEANAVGYRYVGQATPAAAPAPTDAMAISSPPPAPRRTVRRALGGPVPEQAHPARAAAGSGPRSARFSNPRQEASYQAWVAKLPPSHRGSIDPKTGNGRDYDYRRAFEDGVATGDNGHFTDRYKLPNHRTFSTESMYFNEQTRSQAGKWQPTQGGGNRWVPLDPKVKQPFEEDAKGEPVGQYREGGQLPPSVIADGQLHSQSHQMNDHLKRAITSKGVPIIQLHEDEKINGSQVAELEKDELTMSHELTEKVNAHAEAGEHEALGKLVAEQLRTNTIPSKRFRRRLAQGGQVPHDASEGVGGSALHFDQTGDVESRQAKSMAMLSPDGGTSVQMWLRGGERIFSREHTRELVTESLRATTPQLHRRLGRRVSSMLREQNKKLAQA